MLGPLKGDLATMGVHFGSSILLTIIPIFDLVVAPTTQSSSNLSPLWSLLSVKSFDRYAFFWGNGSPVDRRLEVLMVALPALFRISRTVLFRYIHPRFSAVVVHQIKQPLVLYFRPWALFDHLHDSSRAEQGHDRVVILAIKRRSEIMCQCY